MYYKRAASALPQMVVYVWQARSLNKEILTHRSYEKISDIAWIIIYKQPDIGDVMEC
jgi:hypothetical protein